MRHRSISRRAGFAPALRLVVLATGLATGLAAGLASAAPAYAQSQPKVVVAPFKGPAKLAKQARSAVTAALEGKASVVPANDVKLASGDAAAYARFAQKVGVDGVVTGRITGKGKRRTLKLAVRAATSGEVVREASVRVQAIRKRERRAIRAAARGLADTLAESIANEPAPDATADEASGEPAPTPANEAEKSAGGDASAASSVTASTSAEPAASTPWLRGSAGVGWSFVARSLDFGLADGVAEGVAPVTYERPPASGVAVAGEIYPLGFLGRWIGNLGVTFSFERTLGLRSNINEGDEGFGTVQQRWGAGLVYLIPVTGGANPLSIRVSGGVGQLTHTIDTGDVALALPDVDYRYAEGGLGVRWPVAGFLAINLDARYLHVMDTGDIAAMDNYGPTSVLGLAADGNVEVVLFKTVAVRVGARAVRMGLDFDGTGMLTDIDGAEGADVTSASDTYWGGYATAGYAF